MSNLADLDLTVLDELVAHKPDALRKYALIFVSSVEEVLAKIATNDLCPVEPQVYSLGEAAVALKDLEERRVAGKVVLVADEVK